MDIHAYPTGARTPVDGEEAARIAARHLPDPPAGSGWHITEFEAGFTVVAVDPRPAAAHRPLTLGGTVHVVDKATGAVSFWPTYPGALVAELYGRMREEGTLIIDAWPAPDADVGPPSARKPA
ncbi:hypothetical protein [Nocardia thailandica]